MILGGRALQRLRDYVVYVAIGIAWLAILAAFAFHRADTGRSLSPFDLNALAFLSTTAIVFGTVVFAGRRAWRRRRFWSAIGVALVLQVGLGMLLLWQAPKLPALAWGILFPVNCAAVEMWIIQFTTSTSWASGRAAQQRDAPDKARS